MKKLSILSSLLFISGLAFGQISIDSSNFVHIGQTVSLSEGLHSSVSLSAAAMTGANQVWDFSTLDSIDSYTMNFENPITGISAAEYPNASFVVNEKDFNDTVSDFYLKSATEVSILGEAGLISGDTLALHFNNKMITFPSSIGSAFADLNRDTALFAGGRLVYRSSVSSEIDGWGSVTMPKGTFPAIKQKFKETFVQIMQTQDMGGNWISVDSNQSITYSYLWWTNDTQVKWPLIEIDYDSSSLLISDISYVNVQPQTTGVQEQNIRSALLVAPNPASDFLDFSVTKQGSYELTVNNIMGRQCVKTQFNGRHCRLHISSLADGIYQYQLINRNDGSTISGKFLKE